MPLIRHAVILAAGRGRRMAPLTDDRPKAMAPYEGTTLIANGIAQISKHIPSVHITVGWKGAMLAEHVMHHGARSVINTDGQSNSWWIYNTLLGELDEPLFVLTCDNVMDLDFARLEEDYFSTGSPACMLVPVRPVQGLDGDWIFHDDHVVTRISRTDPADVYCSGIQVIHPAKVRNLTNNVGGFYAVWSDLIKRRELRISRIYPKRWFTVDTVAQLEELAARGLPTE